VFFKKFNLFKTGEWIVERQNEYKCAFSAFLKQAEEIPSIPTVPQAYGKYLTLKIQRNAAQQGQQAEGKTNKNENLLLKKEYWVVQFSLMEFRVR